MCNSTAKLCLWIRVWAGMEREFVVLCMQRSADAAGSSNSPTTAYAARPNSAGVGKLRSLRCTVPSYFRSINTNVPTEQFQRNVHSTLLRHIDRTYVDESRWFYSKQ